MDDNKPANRKLSRLILTSIFSAGNTYTYCAIRNLYSLSLEGRAPRFLRHCTKKGVPIYCFLVVMIFPMLAFTACSSGSAVAITWFSSLVTGGGTLFPYHSLAATSLTIISRIDQLRRHVHHVHPLLQPLQGPGSRPQTIPLLRLPPALLCLLWPRLDVHRGLHLRLHHLPALVNLDLLLQLHHAAFHSLALHYLESRPQDQVRPLQGRRSCLGETYHRCLRDDILGPSTGILEGDGPFGGDW